MILRIERAKDGALRIYVNGHLVEPPAPGKAWVFTPKVTAEIHVEKSSE